jgi:hypothetical protein
MFEECKGGDNWFNCLNCKFLSTRLCPLEGEDTIEKILNRIRMMENPDYKGFKESRLS